MIVESRTFSNLAGVAASITPSRFGAMYQCLLLRAGDDGCQEIVATDLTTSFVAKVPSNGDPVACAAPAKFLNELVSACGGTLHFHFDPKASQLTISPDAGSSGTNMHSTVRAFPANEYPAVDISIDGMALYTTVTASTLASYIARLKATTADDEFEHVTFTGDMVQSYNKMAITYKEIDLERTVLRIPVSAFTLLQKLLGKTGEIEVYHGDGFAVFVGEGFKLKTALGTSAFHDVSRYRTGTNQLVSVAAADLKKIVKFTAGMTGYLTFAVTADGIDVVFNDLENSTADAFRCTMPHSTPHVKEPFTVYATVPVIKPIINGLGNDQVAFGLRSVSDSTVGLISSAGYAQIFAQANPKDVK